MTKIQKWSHYTRILFQIAFFAIPIYSFIQWVVFDLPPNKLLVALQDEHSFLMVQETPFLIRWICFFISMISDGVLMYIFYQLIKLFNCFELGRIFTLDSIKYIKICSRAFLAWLIVELITYPLLVLALTINNPVGQRILAFSLSLEDFWPFIMALITIVIAQIMDEARKLKEENDFVI